MNNISYLFAYLYTITGLEQTHLCGAVNPGVVPKSRLIYTENEGTVNEGRGGIQISALAIQNIQIKESIQ